MSRAMKDSGIPWIGVIPKEWETLKIKQVMRNKSIKGFPNETVLSLYRDYGVVPKDSRDDNHNVTSEDTSSYKLVDIGDFVINKMKAWQGSMAVSQYRGIISPAYYICHIKNDGVDRRYIHYLLRNDSYKAEYMRLSTGLRVGQWDLNIDDFLSIPMVLPPVPEQQRIAEFLDRKCGEIDEAISLQEEFIEELKAYKQSVITEAVTHGLNPNVKFKDSGIDWIGKIPQEWECTKLKYYISVKSGDAIGNEMISEQGQYPVFGGGEMIGYTNIYNSSRNDLLIGRIGARCGCVTMPLCDSWATDNALILSTTICLLYMYYLLIGCDLNKQNTSNAQPLITSTKIKNTVVPVPPLSKQRQIADYLDNKCSEIDGLIAIKQQKIEELKDYKKSIIYEYVTGKKECIF